MSHEGLRSAPTCRCPACRDAPPGVRRFGLTHRRCGDVEVEVKQWWGDGGKLLREVRIFPSGRVEVEEGGELRVIPASNEEVPT